MANPLDDLPADRLRALSEKLDTHAGNKPEETPHQKKDYALANQAWRMVVELVAGLGIGFAMGYGLDVFFGTLPIFLVVFTLLGFVAGVKTMMATAQELGEKQAAKAAQDEDNASGD